MVSYLVSQENSKILKISKFSHRTLVILSNQARSLHITTYVDALNAIGSALDGVTSVGKNC